MGCFHFSCSLFIVWFSSTIPQVCGLLTALSLQLVLSFAAKLAKALIFTLSQHFVLQGLIQRLSRSPLLWLRSLLTLHGSLIILYWVFRLADPFEETFDLSWLLPIVLFTIARRLRLLALLFITRFCLFLHGGHGRVFCLVLGSLGWYQRLLLLINLDRLLGECLGLTFDRSLDKILSRSKLTLYFIRISFLGFFLLFLLGLISCREDKLASIIQILFSQLVLMIWLILLNQHGASGSIRVKLAISIAERGS